MDNPYIALQTDVTNRRRVLFLRSWNVATSGVGCCGKKNTTVTGLFCYCYCYRLCLWPWLLDGEVVPHPPLFFVSSHPLSTAQILLRGYLMWLTGRWRGSVTTALLDNENILAVYGLIKVLWDPTPLSIKIRRTQWLFPVWTGSTAGM